MSSRSIKSFKLSVILIIILACIPPDALSLNDCYSIITVTTTITITITIFPPPGGDIACMYEGFIGGVFVQYVTVSVVSAICIATADGCWHFELAQPFQFYPTRDRF